MWIRHSLLAILCEGDCYGYQLREEFQRRTGHSRSLNVGQVYSTLDRLERDNMVRKLEVDSTGHVFYAITERGRIEVSMWFDTPPPPGALDDLAMKVALAQSLPGVDAHAVVMRQLQSTAATLTQLRAEGSLRPALAMPDQIVALAALVAAQAEFDWLEQAELLVRDALSVPLESEPPRRGRPSLR